jgi:hypothetical protein
LRSAGDGGLSRTMARTVSDLGYLKVIPNQCVRWKTTDSYD